VKRRVEHVETDASGVMHFSRYASIFESAVLDRLEDWGVTLDILLDHRLRVCVRDLRLRYHTPARFGDRIDVQVKLEHLTDVRLCFRGAISITDSERLLAEGQLQLAIVTAENGNPACLPRDLHALLAAHAPTHGVP
jgi:acyl-CoA thioester hydrolase